MAAPTRITHLHDALSLFFTGLQNPDFAKSQAFHTWSERDLLVPMRTFLLGYFGELWPEAPVELPGTTSGAGRIDFKVGSVALEVAVRRRSDPRRKLLDEENMPEVKKLMRYDGPSALALLDFSDDPLTRGDLSSYRVLPSLGKGNWTRYPFSVLYFHGKSDPIRLNIQP